MFRRRWSRFGHDIQISDYNSEQVIEIVCKAAGQLSNGFHFLSLKELIFGLALNRDILGKCHNVLSVALLFEERKSLHSYPTNSQLTRREAKFIFNRLTRQQCLLVLEQNVFCILMRQQVDRRLAYDFVAVIAE